jgi:hypothetical protein
MGMYDTIIFARPIPCSKCGAEIRSDQIKAFDCALHEYRIGDCIAHAEEIRVVSDELYCEECKAYTTHYYLAVHRGVLVGIEQEREAAELLLRSFNFEKLLLWYHDLYHKRQRTLADNRRAAAFMRNVCEWFGGGYDKLAPEDEPIRRWLFIWDRKLLEQSETPLAALRHFLSERAAEEGAGDDAGQLSLW